MSIDYLILAKPMFLSQILPIETSFSIDIFSTDMGRLLLLMWVKVNYYPKYLPFPNYKIYNICPKICFKLFWKGKEYKSLMQRGSNSWSTES